MFMVGAWEILDESIRDHARRSRAMSIFPLETNGNERVGTLRFSLWKPSPSALWFFSFKSWWLAGAGLVARGRHLMVPELSSGAPGPPCAAIDFFSESDIPNSFSNRVRGDPGARGGTHSPPSHSEVVFELAGYRRSRKRPQSDLGGNGSPHIPKRRTPGVHGRAIGNSSGMYTRP